MTETPSPDPTSPPMLEQASALVELGIRATEAYQRSDLLERLERSRDRLASPDVNALVVGEFKQGKSTLVNAVLNVAVCPVDDDISTIVPTIMRHGAEASATVEVAGDDERAADDDGVPPDPRRESIELRQVTDYASEAGNPGNRAGVRAVEVRLPRRLLESGLALVDTPGVGGLESVHGAATLAALGTADVVVFVTDASQELSASELEFVRLAAERCPNVLCVVTKTDLYPSWRRIMELDQAHLASVGLDLPIMAVSSVLREMALRADDAELNAESGYPELVRHLQQEVIGRAHAVLTANAMAELSDVVDQLEGTFQAEHEVLADPERLQAVRDDLTVAKARADELRSRAARWQQTLSDGSQDLMTEVDHDLRARLRQITAEIEATFDANDPTDIWDSFSAWLVQRTASEVARNYHLVADRAADMAKTVGEHFAIDQTSSEVDIDVELPTFQLPGFAGSGVDLDRAKAGGQVLTAMRGSYGGILMFGMVGNLAGLALLNPFTLVVGLGLGRKAMRDEKKRSLTIRQQQAKVSCRRYLDDVSFTVGKDSRDFVRRVQRDIRDTFTARAEELQTSVKEALAAADRAAREAESGRAGRLADVEAELTRLSGLRERVQALAAAAAGDRP